MTSAQVNLQTGQEKKSFSTNQGLELGTLGYTRDGRRFRWALAGGTALAGSVMCQTMVPPGGSSAHTGGIGISSAHASNTFDLTLVAGASGISTTLAANQFAGGLMTVHVNTAGLSGPYKVKSHTAGSSATAPVITLDDNDPIVLAMDSATRVGFRTNPYTSVIVQPTTKTGVSIGVTPAPVAVNNFFWLQTGGWAQVEQDVAVAAGATFTIGATAGAIAAQASGAGDVAEPILGWAPTAGAQGNDVPQYVYLTIE